MVPSSADIVLQNHQSETSTINICDVNTMAHAAAEIKMSLLQHFRLLLDYRDIWIDTNERTMACALIPTNYFVVVLTSRQIKRVVRLTACNYPDEKYGSVDCKRYHLIKLIKNGRLNRFHPFNRLNTSWKLIYTLYVNQTEGVLSVYVSWWWRWRRFLLLVCCRPLAASGCGLWARREPDCERQHEPDDGYDEHERRQQSVTRYLHHLLHTGDTASSII